MIFTNVSSVVETVTCRRSVGHGYLTRDCKTNECQRCGSAGHESRECQAGAYTEKLYKELQELRKCQRESYSLDAPSLDGTDPENYIVIVESLSTHNLSETDGDMALLDSGSTHTILRDPQYFEFSRHDSDTPSWQTCKLSTVAKKRKMTFREGRARVKLPRGATLICPNAMFAPEAQRSLISFRDLQAHGIHALTVIMDGEEILKLMQGGTCLATACCRASGLYEIPISSLTAGHQDHLAYSVTIPEKAKLWHWRMGHPGVTMFRRMIPVLTGHEVCLSDANKLGVCEACAKGKLILKPSHWKLPQELPPPLHRLQGDICGPIAPESGPFRYFLVLVDAAGVHFEVSLLSTQNIVFSKILASLIKFRAHYPEYPVKFLRIDNAQEFKSYAFEDYCQATGISLTYSVPI